MSVDENFPTVKRFDVLHLRYLLYLQDTLVELQQRLDACDDAENIQLHLSSNRSDGNEERRRIMRELEMQLPKYGLAPFSPKRPELVFYAVPQLIYEKMTLYYVFRKCNSYLLRPSVTTRA